MQKRHPLCFQLDRPYRVGGRLSAGSYSLTAVATDNSNATTTSAAVNITVTAPPNISPTVSITAPANIALTATATDSDGTISQVQFYDGATLLGTATQQGATSTYVYNWNNVAQGSYANITAKATDNSGNAASNTTSSAPIQLTVTAGVAQVYYIHTDQLNTPRLITNSANAKVWEWNNDDPFANNVPNDDPNNTGNHFEFNHRLPGQYADKETNTHYNYFRDHYFPDQGRYGQSDPIGLAGGINTYSYVENDPLSYDDHFGLQGGRSYGSGISKQRKFDRKHPPPRPGNGLQPSQNSEIKNALDNLNDILDTPDPGEGLVCLEITCTGIDNCGYKYSYTINSFMAPVGAPLYSRADSVSRYGEGCVCTKRRSISE